MEIFGLPPGRTVGELKEALKEAVLEGTIRNEFGEAYAYLTIVEEANTAAPVFQGWMIASSPALNAMDHARFDVWVLRCSR